MTDIDIPAPNYNADIHNDCSPCPQQRLDCTTRCYGEPCVHETKCDKIGTGIHRTIEQHLRDVHRWSQDKIDGTRLGGLLAGKAGEEILFMAHDGILLFSPREVISRARPGETIVLREVDPGARDA